MENDDYSSATGQSFGFRITPNFKTYYNAYGNLQSITYFPYFNYDDVEKNNLIDKLNNYYKAISITTFCDIKRTVNELKNWKILINNPQLDMWFSQYLLDSLVLIDGKNKRLHSLFNLKQTNPGGNDGLLSEAYKNDFFKEYLMKIGLST